ncbi:hypothetical protein ACG7TL_009265 [Trametes sanguinea]
MPRLLIPLNDTIVVCLPAGIAEGRPHYATQITCKTEKPDDIDAITTYYMVRHELNDLVLRIAMAHLASAMPSTLAFEGDHYRLHARHSPWTFGKKVAFMWGNETLESSEDKWTFLFTAKPKQMAP